MGAHLEDKGKLRCIYRAPARFRVTGPRRSMPFVHRKHRLDMQVADVGPIAQQMLQ
jgi:hypothetical protein